MVCSVGLNAASACAAMRAGIANFVELPYHDNQGEPIIGAPVPGIPFDLKRTERLVELFRWLLPIVLKKASGATRQDSIACCISRTRPTRR